MAKAEILSKSLTLPCGVVIPNRIAKAAMTENLADPHNRATTELNALYRLWSEGGAGLLLTGNVQIDRNHMEAAGNVAIAGPQDAQSLAALKEFAKAGTVVGNQLWMQLSHAGRQTPKVLNATPKAPSAVMVNLPGNRFGVPVAMSKEDITQVVAGFANAARVARETGFTGVQIHAAHGYLLSAFLSPKANLRQDEYGGDLAGRARLLLEVVAATRRAVGDDFPVAVKINSADFQRGGFLFEDSQMVTQWLDKAGIDLIEISGGSYEQPSMMNFEGFEPSFAQRIPESTRTRESYFQQFAPLIRQHLKRARLMVTGGFRTLGGMEDALANDGIDMIGIGRPMCTDPAAPRGLLDGSKPHLPRHEDTLRIGPGIFGPHSPIGIIKAANGFGIQNWYCEQLRSLARTGHTNAKLGVFGALIAAEKYEKSLVKGLSR